MLTKIEKTKIYEEAVDQIKKQITNGTWKPGARIPSERELAEQLGIGRPSIREALRVLEVMGLIEIRLGQGTFIARGDGSKKHQQLLEDMLHEDDYVVDLLEVREVIEPQIAFLAAQNANDEDIHALEEIIARMEQKRAAGEKDVEDNLEFHLTLAQAIENRVLYEVMKLLLENSKDILQRYFEVPGRMRKSISGHREILNAIKDHNPQKAQQAMLEHLRTRFTVPNGDGQ